jgi:hypothetical protein
MFQKILFTISAFVITVTSFACSCAYSEEFNLVDYDFYEHIFEVKIESKYVFEKKIINNNKPKPPSLYKFGLLSSYNINILEVFKGDLKLSEKVMGFPNGSSCSWTPEIGVTYIFYTNSLNDVEMCNRILIKKYEEEKYLEEKLILRSLKTKPLKVKIKLDDKIVIEGTHVNGKRNGIWSIYSIKEENKLTFKLTYENGDLLIVEKGLADLDGEEWHSISYFYFTEQVKSKN